MKPLLLAICLTLSTPILAYADDACIQFNALVSRTYNFKVNESHLTKSQIQAREVALDRFWAQVKDNKAKFLPCLRQKVADSKTNPFFRFDGSNLLVELDPSLASKHVQVAVYIETPLPLDTIFTGRWVSVLTQRGTEGFDVSKAAKRALDDEEVSFLPNNAEYADESMSNFESAFFLWASQSEERTTPQLFALANDPKYAQREAALSILLTQATPQASKAIQMLNRDGLSDDAVEAIDQFLQSPDAVAPRAKPKITRSQFLAAFNRILAGDTKPFFDLVKSVPDGEHDAATVLHPQDLPLLRRVRRRFLLGCNRHSLAYYKDFTGIILAVMQKQTAVQNA